MTSGVCKDLQPSFLYCTKKSLFWKLQNFRVLNRIQILKNIEIFVN